MSERHPIDELFDRTLHDAEVTPPPSVWDGIVRERAKRRGGYWSWLLAGLVFVGGASALWFSTAGSADATARAQDGGSPPMQVIPENGTTASGIADATTGQSTSDASGPGLGSATPEPTSPDTPAGTTAERPNERSAQTIDERVPNETVPSTPVVLVASSSGSAEPRATTDHLELLVPLAAAPPARTVVQDSLRTRERPAPYVLPNADWWVALEVGWFDEQRTWYGSDEQLVDALNRTEVPHSTMSLGALAGRSWRSGFGASLGLAYEASQQAFSHSGTSTVQDGTQYFPYMVTLDTQVFVSNVDTVPTYTTTQSKTNATNRFSLIRISGEGYWHSSHRRWTFGPRLGLGTEFMTMRDGYTLDSGSDTAFVAVDAASQEYDTRYATTLTALIGADIGFALNEHWGVWATPTYGRGLATWGSGNEPYMLPERLGLRLRISYTFNKVP